MDEVGLPDLTRYRLQRSEPQAAFEGVRVPGLSAEFFHREQGDRTASVGRYRYAGRDLLMAWGWVDEPHCRYSALSDVRGGWEPATAGCPEVRVVRAGDRPDGPVIGLVVRDHRGRWVGLDRSKRGIRWPLPDGSRLPAAPEG